jgi:hypothetical protein
MDTSGFIPVSVIANFNRVSASLLQPENAWSCSAVSQIEMGMAWEIWGAKILECLFVFTWH